MTESIRLEEQRNSEEVSDADVRARIKQMETESFVLAQELEKANERLRQQQEELQVGEVCRARQARDLEELARELAAARQEGDIAVRAKVAFLHVMTHELLTPMNAILGFTTLMQEDPAFPEGHREPLRAVQNGAEALLHLLQDVLTFADAAGERLRLDKTPFELRRHLQDTLRVLGLGAREKGLELLSRLAPDVPEVVVGDPLRLQFLFLNVVGNAIKFTSQGTVTVDVEVESSSPEGTLIHCKVVDTGVGIPPEAQPTLFEPFLQGDMSLRRKHGGMGLGLALSARLVELMGGRIWVESAVGEGSTFHFTAFLEASDASQLPHRR